jgi:biopolymer transport protein ExbD
VRPSNDDELKAEINVTPLVDVVLVLLKQEVPIELPLAEQSRGAEDSGQVTVSLAADGRRLINGEEVPPESLVERLTAMYAERPQKTIFLEADRSLSHGEVVDLMDDCRAAGIVQIGVVTKKDQPPIAPSAPTPAAAALAP